VVERERNLAADPTGGPMSNIQLIRAAREKVVANKIQHQHWQVRKGPRVAPTVTLEKRAS